MASYFEYRIHPSVGIARMGNSTTTYFLAAEKPRKLFDPASMFKPVQEIIPTNTPTDRRAADIRDADKKLCKQGARFRVFCYEYKNGKPASGAQVPIVWECSKTDYDITWTVQVANRKSQKAGTTEADFDDRKLKLWNSPDPVVLPASSASAVQAFTGKPVGRLNLGSCFVDADGRLVVLGSDGEVKMIGPGGEPGTPRSLFWAGFEDDAADGPIAARVKPKAGSKKPDKEEPAQDAVGAWVVIGLPNYGADMRAATTLYDVAINHAYEMAYTGKQGQKPKSLSALITYQRQILPLLYTYYTVPYTIKHHRGHTPLELPPYYDPKKSDDLKKIMGFNFGTMLRHARSPTRDIRPENIWASYKASGDIHDKAGEPTPGDAYWTIDLDPKVLRNPGLAYNPVTNPVDPGASSAKRAANTAKLWLGHSMPNLEYVTITELQESAVILWENGTLPEGNDTVESSPLDLYVPYQLDRAHMETMSGGSFYPGIEVGRQAYWPLTWEGRIGCCDEHYDVRVKNEVEDGGKKAVPAKPGYLTEFLACPWQADFYACDETYWPHSRPIEVLQTPPPPRSKGEWKNWMSDPGGDLLPITFDSTTLKNVPDGIVYKWWKLGFVRYDASGWLLEKHRSSNMSPRNVP